MELETTAAYGLDVVLAIDASVYEITEDARGRAHAFQMDAGVREGIADAARTVLADLETGSDHTVQPQDVASITIEPGYVRVQLEPSTPTGVSAAAARALRRVGQVYTERHATGAARDGLAIADWYVSAYRPDDAPAREQFLERYACEAAPAVEGSILEREWPVRHAVSDHAALAFRYTVPIAPGNYQQGDDRFPFEWDEPARDRFATLVERRDGWPATTTCVAVYPEYVTVDLHSVGLRNPTALAQRVYRAVDAYNTNRGPHPDHGGAGTTYRKPRLSLAPAAYVEGHPVSGATADAWIADRALEAVEGDPVEPDAGDDPDADAGADGRGAWTSALNPFGGE